MNNADDIYEMIYDSESIRSNPKILKNLCEAIRNASAGDQALAVYFAKEEGWWDQDNRSTCNTINKSFGNRALAIYFAKSSKWWEYDNTTTCECIRSAPPSVNKNRVIRYIKDEGWWDDGY